MDHVAEAGRLLDEGGFGWMTPSGHILACRFENHLGIVLDRGELPLQAARFRELEDKAAIPPDDYEWPIDGWNEQAAARRERDTVRWEIVDRLYAARWLRLGTLPNGSGGVDIEAEGAADVLARVRGDLAVVASALGGTLSEIAVRRERLEPFKRVSSFTRPFGQRPAGGDTGNGKSFRTRAVEMAATGHGWMSPQGEVFAVADRMSFTGLEAHGAAGDGIRKFLAAQASKQDAIRASSRRGASRMHLMEVCWLQDAVDNAQAAIPALLEEHGWLRLRLKPTTGSDKGTPPVLEADGLRRSLRLRGPDLRDLARLVGATLNARSSNEMGMDPLGPTIQDLEPVQGVRP